jgi:hypothetical protein
MSTSVSKLGSEEEGVRIMDNESARGKNDVEIQMTNLRKDSGNRNVRHGGISVQKDWSISVDERRDNGGLQGISCQPIDMLLQGTQEFFLRIEGPQTLVNHI